MCGLVAWAKRSGVVNDSLLRGIRETIAHRGPDDSGEFISADGMVGLGFRRLSIIDLSPAGHQPMTNADGTLWIVFNGEVYNYAAIRPELEAKGHTFRSQSDTEVILHAYEEWGVDCVQRFIGMFAIVIWDSRKRVIFAARDRLGIKPLYYSDRNDQLVLASELKPIINSTGFDKTLDRVALYNYLTRGYITPPETIFRAARSLSPGCRLTWQVDSGVLTIDRYWSALEHLEPTSEMRGWAETDWLEALDEMARSAVAYRLISDVPLGAFLSGGIDSSLVVALMRQVSNAEVKTFTIGFGEADYNEADEAGRVAQQLGTTHTTMMASYRDAQELIRSLPIYFDEPFADSSQIPTLLVSKLTRQHVTVALSGDGGDELFCGYEHYRVAERLQNLWRLPQPVRSLAGFGGQFAPVERWRLAMQGLELPTLPAFIDYFNGKWRPRELLKLAPNLQSVPGALNSDETGYGFYNAPKDGQLSGLMLQDIQRYLPADILTKVDRASMAVSLEARVPLLDHRFVQLALKMPLNLKMRQGQSKYLLKQLLYRYVPKALVDRPKMGFGLPLNEWLRTDLRDLVADYLSPKRLKAGGLFEPTVVEHQLTRFNRGESGHGRIWTLLMFQMWSERYLGI